MFHIFPNFKSKILLDRVLGQPNIYQNLGDFTRIGEVSGGCLTGGQSDYASWQKFT